MGKYENEPLSHIKQSLFVLWTPKGDKQGKEVNSP